MRSVLTIASCLIFVNLGVASAKEEPVPAELECQSLTCDQRELRLQHARELLGKHYNRSTVRVGENIPKINEKIYVWTKQRLPRKFKSQYQKIAQAIIDESLKYEYDPVFLMSIIESESSFRPEMKGGVGEIGLMQIRPATGKWIAGKYGLKWKGSRMLFDPIENIRIGAAYLDYLRGRFGMHARLYLAAYNMGQGNVLIAQEKKIWPKDYPGFVMRKYVEFYSDLREKEKSDSNG